ncbi:MAG: hypothetical protein EOM35_08345 [Negativicutes bacterium]|nr:hypothetical protein [Negativicutes bacterium]
MSVFAGRLSNKTVFSINTQAGGDTNIHTNPNNNSIFHSDMPHLYVEERYRVNLQDGGDGYRIGEMPAALRAHMNAGNRVILPILVYTFNGKEYRRQMTGRHEGVGYSWYRADLTELGACTASRHGATFPDQMLEWGTFIRGTGRVNDEIAKQGTGGMMVRFSYGQGEDDIQSAQLAKYGNGDSAIFSANVPQGSNKPEQRYWNPNSNPPYPNVLEYEYYNIVNPNWIAPLGPKGGGHTHIFCRTTGGRVFGYSKIYVFDAGPRFIYSDPYNPRNNYPLGECATSQTRGDFQAYLDRGVFTNFSQLSYPITLVAMEFLVTNLAFDRTGGYTARNIFTGNEIAIGNDTLTIKGINLRSTQFEFLTSVSTGAPPNNANNFFATNNQTSSMATYPDGGSLGMPGIAADGSSAMITPSGGTSSGSIPSWKVGTYKVPVNSSVELNGSQNYLALDGKQIWSPSVRPLMMFNGQKASNLIIGQNDWLINVPEGSSSLLNSVNIGLSGSGISTIIMSMEYMAVGLHCSGDRAFELGADASQHYRGMALRVNRADYDVGDAITHQIIVLQPGYYVPIMSRRNISFRGGGGTQVPRSNIVYYVRKNPSSGVLEFWVYSFSKVGWINAPKFRINVQRLT